MGGGDGSGSGTLDLVDESLGARDTVDVSGVVAEEDTTERGKGANQVGLPGDGGLDAVDIAASSENDTARHDECWKGILFSSKERNEGKMQSQNVDEVSQQRDG